MDYLTEEELYIYWYLSESNEEKTNLSAFIYGKKNFDSYSGELFIYQLKEIFEKFDPNYSLGISLVALKNESSEITKTTNYYGLGKELWLKLKKGTKVTFNDLLKLDYEKIDFSRPTFLSALIVSYSKTIKQKVKVFLKKYLIKFIRDELDTDPIIFEGFETNNRFIGAFHSFRDFGSYIKKQIGKFLPKNIKVTKEEIANLAVYDLFSESEEISSKEYYDRVRDYMSGYRFLDTILSSELIGFIKIKHINKDGVVYVDRLDKNKSNENYNKIIKKENKNKKENIENNFNKNITKIKNTTYINNKIGYFLIEDKNIEIGPEKNTPFKFLQALMPIGTSKDIDEVFEKSSKRESYKREKLSALQKVDILKNRMKELQEVLRKNKVKIKMGHNEIAKKVFLDWVRS